MIQTYQDAMAIVRKHGKADLFITFTANQAYIKLTQSQKQCKFFTDWTLSIFFSQIEYRTNWHPKHIGWRTTWNGVLIGVANKLAG